MNGLKLRIAKAMRRWADRLDDDGAPKLMNLSFTFEDGIGMVIHSGPIASREGQIGCQLAYLHEDDYRRAHADAGRRSERYESYPLTANRADRRQP